MIETHGGFLISQIKQIQGRIFERLLADAGIGQFNGAQGRILYVLWRQDALPIVELARRTGLAKSTLTSMLDRMELKGHIARLGDRADRRRTKICLTPQARGLSAAYLRVSGQMNAIFYDGFSDGEIQRFEDDLRRILDNLTHKEISE
jgi:Transcriptional regulators